MGDLTDNYTDEALHALHRDVSDRFLKMHRDGNMRYQFTSTLVHAKRPTVIRFLFAEVSASHPVPLTVHHAHLSVDRIRDDNVYECSFILSHSRHTRRFLLATSPAPELARFIEGLIDEAGTMMDSIADAHSLAPKAPDSHLPTMSFVGGGDDDE